SPSSAARGRRSCSRCSASPEARMRDWRRELRGRLEDTSRVEELAQHLEELEADLLAAGSSPAEAEARAQAELDEGLQAIPRRAPPLTATPGAPGRGLVSDLGRDVRGALRALARSKGFTAVTLLSLALGIGANVAFFQLLSALALRPLPVRAPEELVT